MPTSKKLAEKALGLSVLAFFAWTPPLVWVFSVDGKVFGLPVLYVYFFLGWALLIALGARLARRLCRATGGGGVRRDGG